MKKLISIVLAIMTLVGLMIPVFAGAETTENVTMWVNCANGKTLNVRTEPATGNNVIGQLDFGTEVAVDYHLGNGWTALMGAGAYEHVYVQTRFLVNEKPTARPANYTDTNTKSTGYADTLDEMNRLWKTLKVVAPYRIMVRPTRASGWVNLRFGPSKSTGVMATLKANDELNVIAELKGWYQVQDPNTGYVGYVSSSYVVK